MLLNWPRGGGIYLVQTEFHCGLQQFGAKRRSLKHTEPLGKENPLPHPDKRRRAVSVGAER